MSRGNITRGQGGCLTLSRVNSALGTVSASGSKGASPRSGRPGRNPLGAAILNLQHKMLTERAAFTPTVR